MVVLRRGKCRRLEGYVLDPCFAVRTGGRPGRYPASLRYIPGSAFEVMASLVQALGESNWGSTISHHGAVVIHVQEAP